MQNFMSCKDTKHLDFSLTDRAHDVQHSVEGTAMADRCSIEVGSDNLHFPLLIIKQFFFSLIEKLLYRNDELS